MKIITSTSTSEDEDCGALKRNPGEEQQTKQDKKRQKHNLTSYAPSPAFLDSFIVFPLGRAGKPSAKLKGPVD